MEQKSYTNPALNPTWELRVKETKRQRDKETKRQRDKESKRQRDKETKRRGRWRFDNNGDNERQLFRVAYAPRTGGLKVNGGKGSAKRTMGQRGDVISCFVVFFLKSLIFGK